MRTYWKNVTGKKLIGDLEQGQVEVERNTKNGVLVLLSKNLDVGSYVVTYINGFHRTMGLVTWLTMKEARRHIADIKRFWRYTR